MLNYDELEKASFFSLRSPSNEPYILGRKNRREKSHQNSAKFFSLLHLGVKNCVTAPLGYDETMFYEFPREGNFSRVREGGKEVASLFFFCIISFMLLLWRVLHYASSPVNFEYENLWYVLNTEFCFFWQLSTIKILVHLELNSKSTLVFKEKICIDVICWSKVSQALKAVKKV